MISSWKAKTITMRIISKRKKRKRKQKNGKEEQKNERLPPKNRRNEKLTRVRKLERPTKLFQLPRGQNWGLGRFGTLIEY